MRNTTAILDADELAFRACAAAEFDFELGDHHYLMSEFSAVKRILDDSILKIEEATGATEITFALSDRKNFRHGVDETYKGNRKGTRKPLAFKRSMEYIESSFRSIRRPLLEADDVMGLYSEDFDWVVATDKDLKTIPGNLFSPQKNEKYAVTEEQANWFWLTQCLTGDRTDGYMGCKGIGPVRAQKIIDGAIEVPGEVFEDELAPVWDAIVATYEKAGATAQDALVTARLARILRPGEYDEEFQTPILWSPGPV